MKDCAKINVHLAGRPGQGIIRMNIPGRLYLPLQSRRFRFDTVIVAHGARVGKGAVLAIDKNRYSVPLPAPCGGTVDLESSPGHITITTDPSTGSYAETAADELFHVDTGSDHSGKLIYRLIKHGVWHFLFDCRTNDVVDPCKPAAGVIVSTVHLDSFVARGDVCLKDRLPSFMRGLEYIQAIVGYCPIYLAIPHLQTALALEVKEAVRGYASIKVVEIPLRYPLYDFRLLIRRMGMSSKGDGAPVWGIRPDGVIAIDKALTDDHPVTSRIISIGGPGVAKPAHVEIPAGYPVRKLVDDFGDKTPCRIINGGMFMGHEIEVGSAGIDLECDGITMIPISQDRELLGFMRPGISRKSYAHTFLSALRPRFAETLTTALKGEQRPCVNCGFCAEVCPVNLRPADVHKLLYARQTEGLDRYRPHRCLQCGLCTYVCPSKIDLKEDWARAREILDEESAEMEAAAQ